MLVLGSKLLFGLIYVNSTIWLITLKGKEPLMPSQLISHFLDVSRKIYMMCAREPEVVASVTFATIHGILANNKKLIN